MEVGLGSGHIVLDEDAAPLKRGKGPSFRGMYVVAKRLNGSRCHLVSLGPSDIVLDGDPAELPHIKGHSSPHFSAHVYCGQTVVHLSNC